MLKSVQILLEDYIDLLQYKVKHLRVLQITQNINYGEQIEAIEQEIKRKNNII